MIRLLLLEAPAGAGALRAALSAGPDVELATVPAAEGADAAARLRPDVVLVDLRDAPGVGLAAIERIAAEASAPVLGIARTDAAGRTAGARALAAGAIEVLEDPWEGPLAPARLESLRLWVRAASGLPLVRRRPVRGRDGRAAPRRCAILGIGASTGGPEALRRILGELPADFPVPVVIVQHVADGFAGNLARWLGGATSLEVAVARDGDRLAPGRVLIAPDDRHLVVELGRVLHDDGPPIRSTRPSATVLFRSLAAAFGSTAAGLVLTGMGEDGAEGLERIRARGGWTAAQGPRTALVDGMPKAARDRGAALHVLELEEVGPALRALVRPADGEVPRP